ncbi:MAG: endonuclease/exonuclease/phosphatase family protein [Desulfobaccales bacterium]
MLSIPTWTTSLPRPASKGPVSSGNFFFPKSEPLILAGDFNEPPDAAVYQAMLETDHRLLDTWRAVHPRDYDPPTQHDFTGRPRGHRIDWILVTAPFRVTKAEIIEYNHEGRYLSDHFPYLAEVEY